MGAVVAGRYQLVRMLGSGGMKEVWRATDQETGEPVAVAVLRYFDPEMFANELALARRIHSPHVARVLDGGVDDASGAYVVIELCEGPDLGAYRSHQGRLDWREVAGLGTQLALGLGAIHEVHVLHRDVKPENAIFTRDGIKLIDFGISLPAADANTDVGSPMPPAPTMAYMAPEVFRGEIDARTDIYALGITLYELGAGRPPLLAANPAEMVARVLTLERHDLSAAAGAPLELRELLTQMTDAERDNRPFAPEVIDRLMAMGCPAPAFPESLFEPVHTNGLAATVASPTGPTIKAPQSARTGPSTDYVLETEVALGGVVEPCRVIPTPWPDAPHVALLGDRETRVTAFDPGGEIRWRREVRRALVSAVAADLDADGAAELYAVSADALVSFDPSGEQRFESSLARPRARGHDWERRPPGICVGERDGQRCLVIGGELFDAGGARIGALTARYQSRDDILVDAAGTTGFSIGGPSLQAYRGDFATPAAIVTRPGEPGFSVAALERRIGHPSVRLSIFGPKGKLSAGAQVGRYNLGTAPLSWSYEANDLARALFDAASAPVAVVSDQGSVVVVPYLVNAPFWGPVVVAFDLESGIELWRTRLQPLARGAASSPPLLRSTRSGAVELLAPSGNRLERIDIATGARLDALDLPGAPISLGDAAGRGREQLALVAGDRLLLCRGPATDAGQLRWVGPRGDLWRSGCLGPDGLPVGPVA